MAKEKDGKISQKNTVTKGQKDIAEKTLEDYNDVFADILNVCLFDGKREVLVSELKDAKTTSAYEGRKGLRAQERDVAKFWEDSKIRMAFLGLENQTEPERDAPLRIIGYDGAAYRDQLYKVRGKRGKWAVNRNPRYPVITLILYFGYKKHWDQPRHLHQVLENIPEKLKPYVNDYEIHVFEVAWMTDEQLEMLKSDFKIIAEYLVQMRKGQEYTPSKQEMVHAREVLTLMQAVTNDARYEEAFEVMKQKKEEPKYMCEALDIIENRGETKGIRKGIRRSILSLLDDLGNIPVDLKNEIECQEDMDLLNQMLKLAAKADSFEDFQEKLDFLCADAK